MASNFTKLDKFKWVDLRRWQKNMHFLLSSMGVVYVLTTPMPEDGGDNPTVLGRRIMASQRDDDVAWRVDSGATMHMCKDKCWFKTYESLNDGSILYMGNESTALVYGCGCVDLRFSSGKVVSLLNVLHVPTIRKNLVSSSVMNNCGYKQVIEYNKFVLSKHGVFIGFGYLSNHMFRLNIVFDNIGLAFMSTSKLNDSILWHARLGHVYFKRIQDMFKDGLILAFDMDTKKYKTCMLTKITKKPFQNVKRKTKVLKLIHSDFYDLHATPSLGNKKYFVTFINDASRYCGPVPLKNTGRFHSVMELAEPGYSTDFCL
nr:zinc finger, CCHC-type [Tanacetum cinerariifolium]